MLVFCFNLFIYCQRILHQFYNELTHIIMLITLFYLLAKLLNVHTCYIDTSDGCGLSFLLTTLTASFWPVASDLCVCVCYPSIFCRVVKTYVEILVKFALLILFYLIKISFLKTD